MQRRNFLKNAALLGAGTISSNLDAKPKASCDTVKFCAFADLHYRDGDYNWASKRLADILRRASDNNVDFVIHCGDFCHNVKTAKKVLEPYNNFAIPTYHIMGNHDFEATKTLEEVCSAYKLSRNYYSFDVGDFRFIALDPNYFKRADGSIVHYAASSAYEKCHQKMAILPREQIDFLREKLASAKGPCVVFSHHGFRCKGGITNADEVKAAVRESQCKPLLWVCGHFHRNFLSLENDAAFFVLNSPTSDWMTVVHNAYPPELMKKSPLAKHELLFDKPVSAIITVSKDGEFTIDGMKGGMYLGITPEMIGEKKFDCAGLECDASVLSAHFKLYSPRR